MSVILTFLRKELYLDRLVASLKWWIFLVPIVSIALVYVADQQGWKWLLNKSYHETLAIYLTGGALLLALLRLVNSRRAFFGIMSFLAAAILFREIHPPYTGNLVYLNVIIAFVWMYRWRERIEEDIVFPWTLTTFIGTWACYACALLIARRVFKFVPGEKALHIPLEETLESAGHILWLLMFVWARPGRTAKD